MQNQPQISLSKCIQIQYVSETFASLFRTHFMHSILKIPLEYASKFRKCYAPKARRFLRGLSFRMHLLKGILHKNQIVCAEGARKI